VVLGQPERDRPGDSDQPGVGVHPVEQPLDGVAWLAGVGLVLGDALREEGRGVLGHSR
jgi:hypothetical protein